MHCNRLDIHSKVIKGDTLYPVLQCSHNRISSTSCRSQGHVHNLMCLRVPVIHFPEGNKRSIASINSCLNQTSLKKKKVTANGRKSINIIPVKHHVVKVHDRCTKPGKHLKVVKQTNEVGVQFCHNWNRTDEKQYLQKSNYVCSKTLLNSLNNVENLDKVCHKSCEHINIKNSSKNCNVKVENCIKRSYTNQLPINQLLNYEVSKCPNHIQTRCCDHRNLFCARKSNNSIPALHEPCQCPLETVFPIQNCSYSNPHESCCTKYYRTNEKISYSDQKLGATQNRLPIYNENNFVLKRRREPCKVVCSDIVTCCKHDDILIKRKPKIYCHKYIKNHTKPICEYLRNLQLEQPIKNAEISCSTQFKKHNFHIHHNQSHPSKDRNALKRHALYPRICNTLTARRHRSCSRPDKTYIHIPFKLWKCKIYLCDHLHNKSNLYKTGCIAKRKKFLHCMKKHSCASHKCGKCKRNKRCKCMITFLKCLCNKIKNKCKMYRKCQENKCKRRRRPDYDCNQFFEHMLRKRPLYPDCLQFCRLQLTQCMQMMCMACTFLIWCPFFVTFEICKLCFCF